MDFQRGHQEAWPHFTFKYWRRCTVGEKQHDMVMRFTVSEKQHAALTHCLFAGLDSRSRQETRRALPVHCGDQQTDQSQLRCHHLLKTWNSKTAHFSCTDCFWHKAANLRTLGQWLGLSNILKVQASRWPCGWAKGSTHQPAPLTTQFTCCTPYLHIFEVIGQLVLGQSYGSLTALHEKCAQLQDLLIQLHKLRPLSKISNTDVSSPKAVY